MAFLLKTASFAKTTLTPADVQSQEAIKALIALGLVGGGLGAGARSLTGLRDLLRTKGPGVAMTSSVPTSMPITVPGLPQLGGPEEEEKFAGDLAPGATGFPWGQQMYSNMTRPGGMFGPNPMWRNSAPSGQQVDQPLSVTESTPWAVRRDWDRPGSGLPPMLANASGIVGGGPGAGAGYSGGQAAANALYGQPDSPGFAMGRPSGGLATGVLNQRPGPVTTLTGSDSGLAVPKYPRIKLNAATKQAQQPAAPAPPAPSPSMFDHPLATMTGIPSAALVGGASVLGGWSLVDWLLNQRKKSVMQSELGDAEEEYEQSLRDQYSAAMASKHASDAGNPLPELDLLYDAVAAFDKQAAEKRADGYSIDSVIPSWLRPAIPDAAVKAGDLGAGVYLTGLGALGVGSGYATYNWAKARNQQKLLQKALELRARQRMAPQPVYALPVEDEEYGQTDEAA